MAQGRDEGKTEINRRGSRDAEILAALGKFHNKSEKYRYSTWRSYGVDVIRILEEFGQLFNLAPPRSRGKRLYWVKVAKECLEELGSADRVIERMQWLVAEQTAGRKRFDVYSPRSIFTVITAVPLDEVKKDQGIYQAIKRRLEQGMSEETIVERYVNMKARGGQVKEKSTQEIAKILEDIGKEEFDYNEW